MSYASITFQDKNPVKRWLQASRLKSAVGICGISRDATSVCDYGAGNGELCKLLAEAFPQARLVCFEPSPHLLSEARENLAHLARRVEFVGHARDIPAGKFEAIFCLEVFEHLPPAETDQALNTMAGLLADEGRAVIGVPVEVGIPAAYKGIFRMLRRYGAFDANMKNILAAFLGCPPKNRPIAEIAPGMRFCFDHMGFNHRHLRRAFAGHFELLAARTSPFGGIGTWFMPEINFVLGKRRQLPAKRSGNSPL